jgi:hypothetical protein
MPQICAVAILILLPCPFTTPLHLHCRWLTLVESSQQVALLYTLLNSPTIIFGNKNGSLQVEKLKMLAHAMDRTHSTMVASFQEWNWFLLNGHVGFCNLSQRQRSREQLYICPSACPKMISFQSDDMLVGPQKASMCEYEAPFKMNGINCSRVLQGQMRFLLALYRILFPKYHCSRDQLLCIL